MKHKKIIYGIVIALILFSCLILIFRYHSINKNKTNLYGVRQEIFIQKNKLIHASNIDFKVNNYKVIKKTDQTTVLVNIELQKTGITNFGFHKNNSNFFENMAVSTTDYSFSWNPSIESLKNNVSKKSLQDFKQGRVAELQLTFDISNKLLESSNNKLKFRFLIPRGNTNSYIKYSLLLE